MISSFFNFVEIKTKITSIFAFLMSLGFLFYSGQPLSVLKTGIFFIGMFLFDLTTTAINNYIDTKTNDQKLAFARKRAFIILLILLLVSVGFGIWLVILTDIIVLFLGGLCFICGVFYTYGPVPISRQPFGEFFSGIFYGLLIPMIILYINMPQGYYLSFKLNWDMVWFQINTLPALTVLLLSVNPVCCTANIMLANNICDLERDIKVKRYTLPYYIGEKALGLFAGIYYITYMATIIMVVFKMLHPVCLLSLITIIPVQKNIKIFSIKQEKETTFLMAIKNYVIIMGAFTLTIFISGFIR